LQGEVIDGSCQNFIRELFQSRLNLPLEMALAVGLHVIKCRVILPGECHFIDKVLSSML
jgi:hypothetical protein